LRILHTADWHLCDRLGNLKREPDLTPRVERVAALCEEYGVEVLIVAGDLFSEQATQEEIAAALDHVRRTFAGFFSRGGVILAVTGNHDRDQRIDMVRGGMALASPRPAGPDGVLPGGRMYLQNGASVARLRDRAGQAVQFVLVPYPFAYRYGLSATEYRSKEEETRLLQSKVKGWIGAVTGRADFDQTLQTVLVAHLHVRGAELTTAYKVTERDDVLFEFADLNPSWAYVALGHIHKPHTLGGADHVRYPGSLDRLDFGETHGANGVALFDIGPTGLVGAVTTLPIPPTPFHTITLTDVDTELPGLADKYPDAATAIVKLSVTMKRGGILSRAEVERQLRAHFPRRYELTVRDDTPEAVAEPAEPSESQPERGFEQTVHDYLTARLDGDPDRAALLALADQFLKTPEAT
jgi:exonuclease SbcD